MLAHQRKKTHRANALSDRALGNVRRNAIFGRAVDYFRLAGSEYPDRRKRFVQRNCIAFARRRVADRKIERIDSQLIMLQVRQRDAGAVTFHDLANARRHNPKELPQFEAGHYCIVQIQQ